MNVELATLKVPVSFDLGGLRIPVQELERLQPGRVFELREDAADATIRLRIAGALVAEGKLVSVGKRLGVRVSKVLMDPQPRE